MAAESDTIGQSEIEALLREARGAGQPPPTSNGMSNADFASAPSGQASTTAAASRPRGAPVRESASSSTRSPGDDIQHLLEQAEAAIASVNQPNPMPAGLSPFPLTDLSTAPASQEKATLDLLRDVELDLKIELGRTNMYLEDVLKLKRGSVVTLDKLAGDPVDVYVNGRLIARGEVLVLNDNFCVRVAELISGDDVK